MTLTIQLTPDLEARLLKQAASAGMDAGQFVVSALASRLDQSSGQLNPCGKEEAELLAAINQGLPEPLWQRYRELVSLRREESLSADEHAELLRLSNQIEEDHAQRMQHLAALATLRQAPLAMVMEQLGICPPHV